MRIAAFMHRLQTVRTIFRGFAHTIKIGDVQISRFLVRLLIFRQQKLTVVNFFLSQMARHSSAAWPRRTSWTPAPSGPAGSIRRATPGTYIIKLNKIGECVCAAMNLDNFLLLQAGVRVSHGLLCPLLRQGLRHSVQATRRPVWSLHVWS